MVMSVSFKLVGDISLLIRRQLLHNSERLNFINFILLVKLMSHWLIFYPSLESIKREEGELLGQDIWKDGISINVPGSTTTTVSDMNQWGRMKVQSSSQLLSTVS